MGQEQLADLLEDYHKRRALGESPTAEDYRERSGEDFEEFVEILKVEEELDQNLAGSAEATPFPMPFGDYTLLSELGRGAAGVVYEAVHRDLGRTVALKILKSGFDTHESAIERFKREARACSLVRHDNIVEIYEAGEHDDRHYYAMALLKGRSLKQLASDGELPEPREFARSIAEIADALAALHEQGIVHRDLKPANIMVEPSGRMILADFGLARTVASEQLTQTGESLGTPLYMSPEQLLGDRDRIDGRTDVYGLGATMYALLSGQPLFKPKDVAALMRMIIAERPEDIRTIAPDLPEPLGRIVMKAIEKRRRDRYPDATALREDLRAFASGREVQGRPVGRAKHVMRAFRNQWKLSAIAASLLVTTAMWYALRPPPKYKLTVVSIPVATLFVDGEEHGETQAHIEIKAGRHDLRLECEGFETRPWPVNLESDHRVELVLRPKDPTDPKALAALASAFDLKMRQWEEPMRTRGGPSDQMLRSLFPRAGVRPGDATEFLIHVGGEFEGEGALVFRAGDRELHRREVGDWPESVGYVREPMPAAVLEALAAGEEITWGYVPNTGQAETASFKMSDAKPAARIAGIATQLKDLDERVLEQFKAQVYLDEGLPLAAYRVAKAASAVSKAPNALAVMRAALEQMKLEQSPLWADLLRLADKK